MNFHFVGIFNAYGAVWGKFFFLFFLFTAMFGANASGSCGTPTTVYSAQNGNWNTASTWQGGAVPSSCDFVIINHTVSLNTTFTVGQNGNGGLTVNSGASLTGSNAINIQSGNNYTFTNHGTLSITSLNLYGGSPGARFTNSGTATISNSVQFDANGMVHNYGTLTISANVTSSGTSIYNYQGGTITISGNLLLQGSPDAHIYNSGTLNVNGTNTNDAFKITKGGMYNYSTGIVNVPNGGFYIASPVTNFVYNYNLLNFKRLEGHDAAFFESIDTVIVQTAFINGNNWYSHPGSYIEINGDFEQINKSSSVFKIDGYVKINGNFTNDYIVRGSGGITIAGTSTNSSNGIITDSIDICDASATGVVDNNYGTIGSSVTKCSYTPPTAAQKPNNISGPLSPCSNSAGNVYSTNSISGATYNWSVPSGYTITAGQNTNSITVTAGSTNGIITVTATTSSGPASTSAFVQPTSGTPSTPGTIQGPTSGLCSGGSGYSYTVTPVNGATSYTWTIPGGWTLNTGQNTNTISVHPDNSSGNVSVIANNQCGSSSASTLAVTVSGTPSTPGTITGPTSICSGSGATYSISAISGASSYDWTFPSGWSVQTYPGSGTTCTGCGTSVNVTATGNNTTGNVTVVATNVCATSASNSRSVLVTQGRPSTPVVTGPATPCSGQSGAIYTAAATGGDTYTWTVPGGYTINSGQGTNTIDITPGAYGVAASISVTSTNGCGTSLAAGTKSVTPAFTPAQPGSISGTLDYCPGNSYTYSISSVSGATTYNWTIPGTWTLNSGQGTTSINVTTTQTGGSLSVTAATTSCTSTARTAPATPLVTAEAGSNQEVCASSAMLEGNELIQGSGVWTVISGAGTFANASQYNTVVSNMGYGSNVYRWTCSNGGCAISDEVTVVRDCQATYTAEPTKPGYSNYSNGETLASVTDPDGALTAATITSGTLPAGWGFNSTTGKFTVTDPSQLASGSWNFTVNTVDQYGGISNPQVTISMINPLPVEFASFTGKLDGQQVKLNWSTATELNNNFFSIEKSADGVHFASFAKEQGAGNSYAIRHYTITDEYPYNKVTYYRIKQNDYNGQYAYSRTIRVVTAELGHVDGYVKVYPNPASGQDVNIRFTDLPAGMALVNIYDMKGQQIIARSLNLQSDTYQLSLRQQEGITLQPGLYSVRVNAGNNVYETKFVVE